MSKIIFGFVGQIASGKDVSQKYIADKYGASSHRFSTMLRDILNRLYVDITRENLQNLSYDLRQRFGGDTLARVIAEDVKNDTHEIVIVEGIRRMADIIKLKDFPNFYLISIDAQAKIRYNRLVKRNENVGDGDKTFAHFLADGQAEAEKEIPTVMAAAQYQVNNDGTLDELHQQLEKIISKIKK